MPSIVKQLLGLNEETGSRSKVVDMEASRLLREAWANNIDKPQGLSIFLHGWTMDHHNHELDVRR